MKRLCRKGVIAILRAFCAATGAMLGAHCGPNVCEYGAPQADFNFHGTVWSSQSGQAIPGIRVSLHYPYDSAAAKPPVVTDSSGEYELHFSGSHAYDRWLVRAHDADSSENGAFASEDTLITIADEEFRGGDGDWYLGGVDKNIDITLDPREQALESRLTHEMSPRQRSIRFPIHAAMLFVPLLLAGCATVPVCVPPTHDLPTDSRGSNAFRMEFIPVCATHLLYNQCVAEYGDGRTENREQWYFSQNRQLELFHPISVGIDIDVFDYVNVEWNVSRLGSGGSWARGPSPVSAVRVPRYGTRCDRRQSGSHGRWCTRVRVGWERTGRCAGR
jgi:putative lipoprotein (rSAM/lipoprotein system)